MGGPTGLSQQQLVALDRVAKLPQAKTYFDDAEADPIFPRGMTPALWEQVRTYSAREGPRLLQELMQPKRR